MERAFAVVDSLHDDAAMTLQFCRVTAVSCLDTPAPQYACSIVRLLGNIDSGLRVSQHRPVDDEHTMTTI